MQSNILDAPVAPGEKHLTYSALWRRILAALIDAVVLCVIGGFVALANKDLPLAITLFIMPAFGLLYFVYLIKQSGATGGKMAMHLKVVREDGTALSWQDAALRYVVVFIISSYAVIPYLAAELFPSAGIDPDAWIKIPGRTNDAYIHVPALLFMAWSIITPALLLFNKKRRTLHDFIADTIVIHKPR